MDLKEKLDRQISRAVRDAVIQLSRDEVPDPGTLALAIASGQTVESLVKQAQEKIDHRAEAEKPKPPAESAVFVHPLAPAASHAPTVGANRAPRPAAPAGPKSGKGHPNPLSSKDFEKVTHG